MFIVKLDQELIKIANFPREGKEASGYVIISQLRVDDAQFLEAAVNGILLRSYRGGGTVAASSTFAYDVNNECSLDENRTTYSVTL